MQALMEVDPERETYEDVEQLINKICNRFVKTYGGEFDELKGIANLAYVPASRSYEPGHGTKFTSYISTCVWRRLKYHCDIQRRNVTAQSLTTKEGEQRDVEAPGASDFRISSMLKQLSEDAKQIVQVVVGSPEDLAETLLPPGTHTFYARAAVNKYMKSLGWKPARIKKCLADIKGVL